MAKRRQHWIDELSEGLRERITEISQAVSEAIVGDVPIGYRPKQRSDDEVRAFLNMGPEERLQLFQQLGPDGWQQFSGDMMNKLTSRFGAAAQSLLPMLEGMPVESLSAVEPLDVDGSMGVASAQAEITQLLGFDPFGG
jgi:hypothetical protein